MKRDPGSKDQGRGEGQRHCARRFLSVCAVNAHEEEEVAISWRLVVLAGLSPPSAPGLAVHRCREAICFLPHSPQVKGRAELNSSPSPVFCDLGTGVFLTHPSKGASFPGFHQGPVSRCTASKPE